MLYIGKTPKGKFPYTWQFWNIKIPKPPYISSLKIIGFLHFFKFWGPSEKNYNLQSLMITLFISGIVLSVHIYIHKHDPDPVSMYDSSPTHLGFSPRLPPSQGGWNNCLTCKTTMVCKWDIWRLETQQWYEDVSFQWNEKLPLLVLPLNRSFSKLSNQLFQYLFLSLSLESQMYSGLGGIPGNLAVSEEDRGDMRCVVLVISHLSF